MAKKETMLHKYKMYGIVIRQLDGINSGVQVTHSVCEYARKYWKDKDFQQWINEDKTLIVLNGGTLNNLHEIIGILQNEGIKFEKFDEPDLGGITTCVCLLADERVWDRKEYCNKNNFIKNEVEKQQKEINRNELCDTLVEAEKFLIEEIEKEIDKRYEKFVGGRQNVVKKEILNNLKLV